VLIEQLKAFAPPQVSPTLQPAAVPPK